MKENNNAIELLEAQGHILSVSFTYIIKMCIICAIELGIPSIIQSNSPNPTSLSQLLSSLVPQLHPSKYDAVRRLMRLLVHAGIFKQPQHCNYLPTLASKLLIPQHDAHPSGADSEITKPQPRHYNYLPTLASKLLIPHHDAHPSGADSEITKPQLSPPPPPHLYLRSDTSSSNPLTSLSTWFRSGGRTSSFEDFHDGVPFWEVMEKDGKMADWFYEAMVGDSRLAAAALVSAEECRMVFEEVETLVDVGGGDGTIAAVVAAAFPDVKCIVYDLPHVVDGGRRRRGGGDDRSNLEFVGGSMFDYVPPADAVLLKRVLHNWDDENCVRILKRCKEAISNSHGENKRRGKVIVIDMVVGNEEVMKKKELHQVQLCFDMLMMALVNGKERDEEEWERLFLTAGFSDYKIVCALGEKSVVEAYL